MYAIVFSLQKFFKVYSQEYLKVCYKNNFILNPSNQNKHFSCICSDYDCLTIFTLEVKKKIVNEQNQSLDINKRRQKLFYFLFS